MRRLVPCLIVTLLVLTACDKKKAPTESTYGSGAALTRVGTVESAPPVMPGDVAS